MPVTARIVFGAYAGATNLAWDRVMSGGETRSRLDVVSGRASSGALLKGRRGLFGRVWSAADHLVTLTVRGGEPSLLAAQFGTTGRDPFLRLVTQAGVPNARRMISALLLRLATEEDLPAALIVDRHDAILMDVVTQLADTIPGAVLYPRRDETVIPLRTAAMTRRIVRTIGSPDIVVLDLRSTDESVMTPAMSRLRRARAG